MFGEIIEAVLDEVVPSGKKKERHMAQAFGGDPVTPYGHWYYHGWARGYDKQHLSKRDKEGIAKRAARRARQKSQGTDPLAARASSNLKGIPKARLWARGGSKPKLPK